jgi:hypothetical protein
MLRLYCRRCSRFYGRFNARKDSEYATEIAQIAPDAMVCAEQRNAFAIELGYALERFRCTWNRWI